MSKFAGLLFFVAAALATITFVAVVLWTARSGTGFLADVTRDHLLALVALPILALVSTIVVLSLGYLNGPFGASFGSVTLTPSTTAALAWLISLIVLTFVLRELW